MLAGAGDEAEGVGGESGALVELELLQHVAAGADEGGRRRKEGRCGGRQRAGVDGGARGIEGGVWSVSESDEAGGARGR